MSNPVLPAEARDQRARGWFWANDDVIDRYGAVIGADGIAVYMALARHADRNGQCWPSYATMAERLGISRPTVIKCLARLVQAGLVTSTTRMKAGKSGGERPDSNLYTLLTVRSISDDERNALKDAIKARESGKGDLPHPASNGHSKAVLPPHSGKGDLPHLVNNVDYPSKGDLPGVVKDVVQKETQYNQTHITTPTPCATEPDRGGGGGDSYIAEVRTLLGSYRIMTAAKIASQYAAMEQRPSLDDIRAAVESMYNPKEEHNLSRIARQLTNCAPPWKAQAAPAPAYTPAPPPPAPVAAFSPAELASMKYDYKRQT